MAGFDLNSIGELLAGGGTSAIGKRLKLKQGDVAQVLSNGIPSMIAGMQNNASSADGAASLSHALADHSKDSLADIGAFLKNADLDDGKKILGHIFGGNQNEIIKDISAKTGVTKGKTTSILALVAPLLLSLLGNQQQSQQQSAGFSLAGLLGGLLGGGQQQSSSLLGGLLGGAAAQADDKKEGGLLEGILNLFK
ncbi:MAG: DUF937 domain-containing protein [Clostridiales bacterium]|nr:DUF937 domain-containing protein [Clostridiales bacterium]